MFYNRTRKETFIEDYKRSKVVAETSLTSLFNKTYFYERRLDKDCSEFSIEEIMEMYIGFNAKSSAVLMNYNVILKAYTAKELYDGKVSANNYINIDKQKMRTCLNSDTINSKYFSREDMDEIEAQLLNYTDKAIVECLWQGISGKGMADLISLNANMLDDNRRAINFHDRTHTIDDKLHTFLVNAFAEKEYITYGETMKVKKLNGNNCLYKESDNAHTMDSEDKFFRWVYRKIQTYRKYLGINSMTMKSIQASGLYYNLNKIKIENGFINLRDALATEQGKEIAYRYGYSDSYVDVISNKFQDIE